MGANIMRVIGSWSLIILVIILDTVSKGCVEGLQNLDKNNIFQSKPKGTIKTIKVLEDGDIIDCVDIYKQPSLSHPLNKDLQMTPSISFMKLFNKTVDPQPRLIQNWLKYGECPEGTIPLRRNRYNNGTIHTKKTNGFVNEFSAAYQNKGIYNGAEAVFNVWKPYVATPYEFSLSRMWIGSGRNPNLNTIEAGWGVYSQHFHDSNTRFHTYWTRDSYRETGCYNVDCVGFVQTDRSFVLGGTLPVSSLGGESREIKINIAKDRENNNWWLQVDDKQIGYFPAGLFSTLEKGADFNVVFGGEIENSNTGDKHTTTEMGSGHFPHEGQYKASYIRNILVVTEAFDVVDASLVGKPDRPECYGLTMGPTDTDWKSFFFYGGPGYSGWCTK